LNLKDETAVLEQIGAQGVVEHE